jgi:hypothetical protein
MTKLLFRLGAATFFTLLSSAPLVGQVRPLAPLPSTGLAVTPFMEGWYPNPDGSRTISFGYLNRNNEDVVRIPVGTRNSIEPAQFSGMQPTVFVPGRHRGVFTVTVPAGYTEDFWWTIINQDGQVHKVPGRTTSHAYELDRNPRPTGTVPPRIGFSESGPWGTDPSGIVADQTLSTRVGERIVLESWVEEISQRDPTDPRSEQAKSVRVVWFPHHGPATGDIEFARHESTPEPEPAPDDEEGRRAPPPGPNEVMIQSGKGVARVYATFSAPGEYLVRAQADNWRAADSSSGDQCCWSNSYLRVNVQ